MAIFCYHKVGTVLLTNIFREISQANQWHFKPLMGWQAGLPENTQVSLFCHSLIDLSKTTTPFVGVHVIRDPRDIIVSGYLYHRRTQEPWCTNTNLNPAPPIRFPKVPFSQQHRPEDWKIDYLESLDGKSYQQNLLGRSEQDGLRFEMNHYAAWTIDSMRCWPYGMGHNILEIKFEDLLTDYDHSLQRIFAHLGFSSAQIEAALAIAARHDLARKSESEMEALPHVSSRHFRKWPSYFDQTLKRAFLEKFGNVLIDLGYENSDDW